jgi:hypothetical protein
LRNAPAACISLSFAPNGAAYAARKPGRCPPDGLGSDDVREPLRIIAA